MKKQDLSYEDKLELDKYGLYLRSTTDWDVMNDDLPDHSPISPLQRAAFFKRRFKAHAKIYEIVYGEKP